MTQIVLGLSGFDGFSDYRTSAWKQEGGDRRHIATKTLAFGGVHYKPDFESESDHSAPVIHRMASSVSEEPGYVVGESNKGPRPLKSRPEDRIASIVDNPFYKSFGVKHPRSPRDVPSVSACAKIDADGKYGVREDLGDYRPGSGFVNKLRGRFASLGMREEPPPLHHIKNASSVEDILDRTESYDSEADSRRRDRGRAIPGNMQYRARSVESLSRRRPPPTIPLPVTLRHVERNWDHPTPAKSPRDEHIVAPDVKLARDDIILIENPPSQPSTAENEIEEEEKLATHSSSIKGETPTDELPKPNTVSTVRSLFESGKPLSPTSLQYGEAGDGEHIFTPRDSNLTPRDSLLTPRDTVSTPRDSLLTPRDTVSTPRDSLLTPRDTVSTPRDSPGRGLIGTPRESNSTPREHADLTPRDSRPGTPRDSKSSVPQSPRYGSDVAQRHDASKSRFSWSSDFKTASGADSTNSTAAPPLPTSLPPVTAASSAADAKTTESTVENAKPSLLHGSGGSEVRPPASPRSTAAVKAIPAARAAAPVRPGRPSSTNVASTTATVPPSFTPSIKKTSPVMPVAPFKETKAEEADDNRYLIYAKKSSAGHKPERPARVRDYGDDTEVAVDVTKKSGDEPNKLDSDVVKTNKVNRTHNKGRAPPVPKQRQPEESDVQSPRSPESNENPWSDVLKPTSPRIEDSRPEPVTLLPIEPKKPSAAPRTIFSKPEEKLWRPEESQMETEERKPEDSIAESTNNETEEPSKPIRGIPSIIANRMKQQNAQNGGTVESRPPGELFGVRLGKTRHEDESSEDASEVPRKRLAPAADVPAKETTSNLPSEIENQIASVRKRMESASRNRSPGVSQIFDSSQLQKKKKQAAKSSAQAGVPRLDLSSITAEDNSKAGSEGGYRVTPREIKPCNIEFIGANVSTGRSLLKKNRKTKVSTKTDFVMYTSTCIPHIYKCMNGTQSHVYTYEIRVCSVHANFYL